MVTPLNNRKVLGLKGSDCKKFLQSLISNDINLIDDGLQFHSKIHKKGDGWYDKNLCVVGSEFITFLKESQTKTYEKLSKK